MQEKKNKNQRIVFSRMGKEEGRWSNTTKQVNRYILPLRKLKHEKKNLVSSLQMVIGNLNFPKVSGKFSFHPQFLFL